MDNLHEELGENLELQLWPNSEPYKFKSVSKFSFINMLSAGRLETIFEKSLQSTSYYIDSLWETDEFLYADGSVYKGEFSSGRRDKQGTLTLPSGDEYIGNFSKGIRSEFGKFHGNGYSYKGH